MSIARFIVEKVDRYSRGKKRNFGIFFMLTYEHLFKC